MYMECSYLQGLIKITDALLQRNREWSMGQENAHPAPTRAMGARGDAFPPSAWEGSRAKPSSPTIRGVGGSHEQGWSSLLASSCLSLTFGVASAMSLAGDPRA